MVDGTGMKSVLKTTKVRIDDIWSEVGGIFTRAPVRLLAKGPVHTVQFAPQLVSQRCFGLARREYNEIQEFNEVRIFVSNRDLLIRNVIPCQLNHDKIIETPVCNYIIYLRKKNPLIC